jgi:hypothetical protein
MTMTTEPEPPDPTPDKVAAPIASPSAGAVPSGTAITLSTATSGASIYYTLNGDTPTVYSTPYDGGTKPVITAAATLKAIAVKAGMTDSDVLTAAYTISGGNSEPPPSGSKTLTFKLTPISVNNFTVTVSGGTWQSGTFTWKFPGPVAGATWDDSWVVGERDLEYAFDCSPEMTYAYQNVIVTRTSDTVLTFTLLPNGIQDRSGTIRLWNYVGGYDDWDDNAMRVLGSYCAVNISEYDCVIASDSGVAAYYL